MQILKFCESSPQQLISKKKNIEILLEFGVEIATHWAIQTSPWTRRPNFSRCPDVRILAARRAQTSHAASLRHGNPIPRVKHGFYGGFWCFLLFFAIKSDDFGPCPLYMTTYDTVRSMMSPFSVKGIQKTRFLFCHL